MIVVLLIFFLVIFYFFLVSEKAKNQSENEATPEVKRREKRARPSRKQIISEADIPQLIITAEDQSTKRGKS